MQRIIIFLLSCLFLKKDKQKQAPLKLLFPTGSRIEAIIVSDIACVETTMSLTGTAYMLLPDILNQVRLRMYPANTPLTWHIQQITPRSVRLHIPPDCLLDLTSVGLALDSDWMKARYKLLDGLKGRFYTEIAFMFIESGNRLVSSCYFTLPKQALFQLMNACLSEMQLSLSQPQVMYFFQSRLKAVVFEEYCTNCTIDLDVVFFWANQTQKSAYAFTARSDAKSLEKARMNVLYERTFWENQYHKYRAQLVRRTQLDWLATVTEETVAHVNAMQNMAYDAYLEADTTFKTLFSGVTPEQQNARMEKFLATLKEA